MDVSHRIGIGLIGLGRHGIRYARHIVNDLPEARLAAVCRRHPELGLDLPTHESVRLYGDSAALIADEDVEVVVVVTPPLFAREICLQSVRAGKPILIEKPLATAAADALAMVEAAEAAHVPLMTGHTLRFDATIQTLKAKHRLIGPSQRLELTSHLETKERGPGHADGYGKRGALLEFGVHLLDLVRFLTGEDVRDVRCTMDPLPPKEPERAASVHLVTYGGTECALDVQRVAAGRIGRAVWTGSEGRLVADWTQQRVEWTDAGSRTESRTLSPCATVQATLFAFLDAVRGKNPLPITGWDGFHAVEIAEACYRSAESGGRPVRLPLVSD
jgi:predicted dehydrogenase